MLLALALIPAIALLVIIYFSDKKEKEPLGLLIGLFFAGMATIISALIIESIGSAILGLLLPYAPAFRSAIFALLIVAPAEELGKFVVLRLITWKNKNFDYIFDAIVYAVFVSLGFALFENVAYVIQYGFATAIMRMFTAVPGHTCFAIFMGYFYGKARHADILGDRNTYQLNIAKTIVVPILVHGVYDAILMVAAETYSTPVRAALYTIWVILLIAMFVFGVVAVVHTSKNDFRILFLPDASPLVYSPAFLGTWRCGCGCENVYNFCYSCGAPRPQEQIWFCGSCGHRSCWNFCGNCGAGKPIM